MGNIKKIVTTSLLYTIKFYQTFLSSLFGSCCRFYPSCSIYCTNAIQQHGIYRGLILTFKRILRCHPWCQGGFDPVPEK